MQERKLLADFILKGKTIWQEFSNNCRIIRLMKKYKKNSVQQNHEGIARTMEVDSLESSCVVFYFLWKGRCKLKHMLTNGIIN